MQVAAATRGIAGFRLRADEVDRWVGLRNEGGGSPRVRVVRGWVSEDSSASAGGAPATDARNSRSVVTLSAIVFC